MVVAVIAFVIFGLMALAGLVDIDKLNKATKQECNTCVHGDCGVCHEIPGKNYGYASEISGNWVCENWKGR